MTHSEIVKGDPRNRYFSIGSTDELEKLIREPEIPHAVPDGVRQLLSLADQTFVASYFFYDLCHASLLWTAIATEAALGERFAQALAPRAALFKKGKTNEVEVRDWSSLEWLLRTGWRVKGYPKVRPSLSSLAEWAFQEALWPRSFEPNVKEGLISIRNMMAHATRRSLMPPGPISDVHFIAKRLIITLFTGQSLDDLPQKLPGLRL